MLSKGKVERYQAATKGLAEALGFYKPKLADGKDRSLVKEESSDSDIEDEKIIAAGKGSSAAKPSVGGSVRETDRFDWDDEDNIVKWRADIVPDKKTSLYRGWSQQILVDMDEEVTKLLSQEPRDEALLAEYLQRLRGYA